MWCDVVWEGKEVGEQSMRSSIVSIGSLSDGGDWWMDRVAS